jgi:hypothetical protein
MIEPRLQLNLASMMSKTALTRTSACCLSQTQHPAQQFMQHELCYLYTNHCSRCATSGCLSHWAVQIAALLKKSETVPDLHTRLLGLHSCALAAHVALAALPVLAAQHAHLSAALHPPMNGLPSQVAFGFGRPLVF